MLKLRTSKEVLNYKPTYQQLCCRPIVNSSYRSYLLWHLLAKIEIRPPTNLFLIQWKFAMFA